MSISGSIHVDLCISTTRNVKATVQNTRPSGFLNQLAQQSETPLRPLLASLYALCPIAHLVSFDAVNRRLNGITEDERRQEDQGLAEMAVTLEGIVETLRVFLTDGQKVLGLPPRADRLRPIGEARRALSQLTALLIKSRDGVLTGDALQEAKGHIQVAFDAINTIYPDALTGYKPGVLARTLKNQADAKDWARDAATDTSALLDVFFKLPEDFGLAHVDVLPVTSTRQGVTGLADTLYWRLKNEPGFDMAPVVNGAPHLTGALARRASHPALAIEGAIRPVDLVLARLIDMDASLAEVNAWLENPQTHDMVFPLHTVMIDDLAPGAVALTQTARGLLTYTCSQKPSIGAEHPFKGVISPTEWQFSPGGAAQSAVNSALKSALREGLPPTEEALTSIVKMALFGLDACVPLTVSLREAGLLPN